MSYNSKYKGSEVDAALDLAKTALQEHQDISGKQDVISDLATIRSGAEKGATAVQSSDLATVATSGSYSDLTNKPTIPSAVTESTVSGWGFTKNTGTYSKPSTGIPKTDLASAVQTSLGKADTALQSVPSEYVTETELTNKGYATTSTMNTALADKVDKVSGKGLSTNDFTTALKTKLEGLSNYDDTTISNAVTALQTQLNTLVGGDADTAIESFNEIISFLDGIEDTETLEGIIASIEQQIAAKQDVISDLATIRSNASKGATAVQPSDLADVATSGSYNDLSNKPTIPTVNNATLTIQKNGTSVGTFTANASTNKTINITVPTKVSELTNDSGFKTTDNNTTYTFAGGTNKFTVTPSGGTAQTVTITPSIAVATTAANGLISSSDKSKLDGISTGAEANQNAFAKVTVGSTTIVADAKQDTLTLVAGSNVTLTPDATNDKVTITATDTTYSAATTSAAGLMSAADKSKLDGIAIGANAYSLPNATSSVLGGVKVGSNITVSSGTISLTKANVTAALGYTPPTTDTNTDTKVTQTVTTTEAAYPLLLAPSGLTATTTTTSYFDSGVTLNPSTNTIAANISGNAATATTATSATTATKIGSSTVGSVTQPVYISSGTPTKCTYTLSKSVPSDAVFTDTTYSAATTSEDGLMSAADKTKLNNAVISDGTVLKVVYVSALPDSPDSTTLYIIPE